MAPMTSSYMYCFPDAIVHQQYDVDGLNNRTHEKHPLVFPAISANPQKCRYEPYVFSLKA